MIDEAVDTLNLIQLTYIKGIDQHKIDHDPPPLSDNKHDEWIKDIPVKSQFFFSHDLLIMIPNHETNSRTLIKGEAGKNLELKKATNNDIK